MKRQGSMIESSYYGGSSYDCLSPTSKKLQPEDLIKLEEEKINLEFSDVREIQPDLAALYRSKMPASIEENKFHYPD